MSKNGVEMEHKESADKAKGGSRRIASDALWCIRVLLIVVVAYVWTMAIAMGVLPAIGTTLLYQQGLTIDTSLGEVMARWLVPELFIAALLAVLSVFFLRGVWRKMKVADAWLMAKYDSRAAEKAAAKDEAPAAKKEKVAAKGETPAVKEKKGLLFRVAGKGKVKDGGDVAAEESEA